MALASIMFKYRQMGIKLHISLNYIEFLWTKTIIVFLKKKDICMHCLHLKGCTEYPTDLAKFGKLPTKSKQRESFTMRQRVCMLSQPVNFTVFGTVLRDFLKHQPWIKHLLSFLSSAIVSMVSGMAHKVAYLFLRDFKNHLLFGIEKTF